MDGLYLVGEPIFKVPCREEYYAPVSTTALCREVLKETEDKNKVIDKLREEYLAIIWSLVDMDINFRIIYAHEKEIDQRTFGVCASYMKCRFASFSEGFFPPYVAYPRDFSVVLPGMLLVNYKVGELKIKEKDGCRIVGSPYGDGGRVLFSKDTVLVSERLVGKDDRSRAAESGDLEKIREEGIKVGMIPCPLVQIFLASGETDRLFFNDHLDRIACLIEGRDGNLHLVIDPNLFTANWKGENGIFWTPRSPEETLEVIKKVCNPLGIEVHCLKKLRVPYALNLIQFPDGQILMTGGDDFAAETIKGIVGWDMVFKTPVPIRFFPVFCYAGIHCLVSEAPLPLLKKIPS